MTETPAESDAEFHWHIYEQCQIDGCSENGKVVLRDDPLNGTRMCPEHAQQEMKERGWVE